MTVINLKNASLDFPVYDKECFSMRGKILSLTMGGIIRKNNKNVRVVRALDNITLSFKEGDRVGLIGHNGAGKTTLLKLMAGIYTQTEGEVYTSCIPTPLFDYSLGMDVDATGYQNIILSGLLRGHTRKEIDKMLPDIIDFSDLGEYISMPLRTYSAGMTTRLGFSISTMLDPEILLIDEVFGAGDKNFFTKARNRMKELLGKAKVLVLATHSSDLMKQFCNKVVVLNKGSIIDQGDIENILPKYM